MFERSRKSAEPGFTLVELLVVIAIIAILAALLLPALSGAKLRTYHVVCLGNLKELGAVARLYHQDFGKGTPPWVSDRGLSSVRLCPLAKEPSPGGSERRQTPGTAAHCWFIPISMNPEEDLKGSYAFNRWFDPQPLKSDTNGFPSANSVRFPATTPLFADSIWLKVQPNTYDYSRPGFLNLFSGYRFGFDPSMGSPTIAGVTIARHGPRFPSIAIRDWPVEPLPATWGINVSFADGHVERVRLPDLSELTWHRNWITQTWPPSR